MSATEAETWAGEEFPLAVSGQLRMTRQRLGWTLADVVERLTNQMSVSTLHRIETCRRPLRLEPLWEISTALGVGVVKVIVDAAATVGPAGPLPCLACKGTGVASSTPSALVTPTFSDAAGDRRTMGEGR